MDAAAAAELVVLALTLVGVQEAREERQRDVEDAPVGKKDREAVLVEGELGVRNGGMR